MPPARNNKSDAHPERPIHPHDICTITDVKTVPDVLGYLGFSEGGKDTVQQIAFHPLFLEYYTILNPLIGSLGMMRAATFDQMLPHLRSFYRDDDSEHPTAKSPEQLEQELQSMKKNDAYLPLVAALLWHWEQAVEKLDKDGGGTTTDDDREKTFKRFESYAKVSLPEELRAKLRSDLKMKELPNGLRYAVMKNLPVDETRLEICSRLWTFLWLARQQLFSGSKIQQFLQPADKKSQTYPKCQLPKWWPPKADVNLVDLARDLGKAQAKARPQVPKRKPFRAIPDIQAEIIPKGSKVRWRKLEKSVIDDRSKPDVTRAMPTEISVPNPCGSQSMEMWRDAIRMKLNLKDRRADILTVSMEPRFREDDEEEDDDVSPLQQYDIYGQEENWDHDRVHAKLQDDKIRSVKFTIELTFETDVQMESNEVPWEVQGFLALQNGDVVRVEEHEDVPQLPPIPDRNDPRNSSQPPPHTTSEVIVPPGTTSASIYAQSAPCPADPEHGHEESMQASTARADGAISSDGFASSYARPRVDNNAEGTRVLSESNVARGTPTTTPDESTSNYTRPTSDELASTSELGSKPADASATAVHSPIEASVEEQQDQVTVPTPSETTDSLWEQWKAEMRTNNGDPQDYDLLERVMRDTLYKPTYRPANIAALPLTPEGKGTGPKQSRDTNVSVQDAMDDEAYEKDPVRRLLAAARRQQNSHSWAIPNARRYRNLNQKRTPQDERALDPRQREPADFFGQEYGDQFDVNTPDGLFNWIRLAADTIAPGPVKRDMYQPQGRADEDDEYVDEAEEIHKSFEKKATLTDPQMRSDKRENITEDSALYQSEMTVDHREIEAALSGGEGFAGPPVDLCLKLLGLKEVGTLRDTELRQYRSKDFMPGVQTPVLATQATGMVHMLLRTCGEFPLSNKQKSQQHEAHFQQLAKQLKDDQQPPKVMGGILSDGAGMGKTLTAAAFFDWLGSHSIPKNGKYKPGLFLVPDGVVVNQWAQLINDKFPDIHLFVAKSGDSRSRQRPGHVDRWKSIRAKDMKNIKKFPYKWIFDQNNPQAAKALVLTSMSTWRKRVGKKVKLDSKQQELEKEELPPNVIKDKKDKLYKEHTVAQEWRGRFGTAIFDEGHVLRRDTSLLHWVARMMGADVNWLLTATTLVNTGDDLVNEARILWRAAKKRMKKDPAWPQWKARYEETKDGAEPWEFWKAVEDGTPPTSAIRLAALRPQTLQQLLTCGNLNTIRKYYQIHARLVLLRRTPESRLPGYAAGADGTLHLDSIMKRHSVVTVPLKHQTPEEEREFLMWHRIGSLEYQEVCRKHAAAKEKDPNSDHGPPPVTPAFRKMAICTASTQLSKFDDCIVQKTTSSTKVESLALFREMKISADVFLWLVAQNHDLDGMSRIDRLGILLHGSEKGKEMLRHIRDHMLPKPGEKRAFKKLLITEEFPLIAWFWELILTFLHIPVQVLHSGLKAHEREKVVDEFNRAPADSETHNCSVLILMYTINAAGVNLHHDCHRCIVSTASTTAALEIQAYSRLIRVAQENEVQVFRFLLKNSHDEYRDAMQANKTLIDSALKTYEPETKETLLRLLNTWGKQEAEAILKHSFLGQAVMHAVGKGVSGQAGVKAALKERGYDPEEFQSILDQTDGAAASNELDSKSESSEKHQGSQPSPRARAGGDKRTSNLAQSPAILSQDDEFPPEKATTPLASETAISPVASGQNEASATVTGSSRTSETSLQAEIEEFWAKLELLDQQDQIDLAERMQDCVNDAGLVTDPNELPAVLASFRRLLETAEILDRAKSVDAPGAVGNEDYQRATSSTPPDRSQSRDDGPNSKLTGSVNSGMESEDNRQSPSSQDEPSSNEAIEPSSEGEDANEMDKGDGEYNPQSDSEESDDEATDHSDATIEDNSDQDVENEERSARNKVHRLPEIPALDTIAEDLDELSKSNATSMTRVFKKFWQKKLDAETRQTFDQEIIYVVYLARQSDPFRDDYTLEDLDNDAMLLERALRLMQRRRFGQAFASLRVSPLVDYSRLSRVEQQGLMDKIRTERRDEEIDLVTGAFGLTKRQKRTFEARRSPVIPAPPLSAKEQQAKRDRETKALQDQRELYEKRKAHKATRARNKKENARQNAVSIAPATFMNSSHKIILNPHTSLGKSLADAEDSARDEVVRLLKKTDATDFQAKAYKSVFGKHRDFSELHRIRKDLGLLVEEAADGEEYDGDVDEDGGDDSVEVVKPFMEDEPVMPLEVFDQGPGGEDEAGTKRESDEDMKGESDDLI